jgi:periplasmic protein TonB
MLEVPQFRRRNPLQLAISLAVHILVISALVITPLIFTDTLDLKGFQNTWLVAPPAPPPPPPPAPAVQRVAAPPRIVPLNQLTAPRVIPKKIEIVRESPLPPDTGVIGGVEGGVPGGQSSGVLGGIIGSSGTGPAIAPPPPAPPRIVRVGGNIKPPKQVYAPDPVYPAIARTARVQGTVVIDAIIDEHGNVVQAHAISGPGLLIQAALQAVASWKYEPTRLNGNPVSVEMHVEVNIVLQEALLASGAVAEWDVHSFRMVSFPAGLPPARRQAEWPAVFLTSVRPRERTDRRPLRSLQTQCIAPCIPSAFAPFELCRAAGILDGAL